MRGGVAALGQVLNRYGLANVGTRLIGSAEASGAVAATSAGVAGKQRPCPSSGQVQGPTFKIAPNTEAHIFRNAPGHMRAPSSGNIRAVQSLAQDPRAVLGPDKRGNLWSSRSLRNGQQLWVKTRGNSIQNAGINNTPRVYNPVTGLSRQTKPAQ